MRPLITAIILMASVAQAEPIRFVGTQQNGRARVFAPYPDHGPDITGITRTLDFTIDSESRAFTLNALTVSASSGIVELGSVSFGRDGWDLLAVDSESFLFGGRVEFDLRMDNFPDSVKVKTATGYAFNGESGNVDRIQYNFSSWNGFDFIPVITGDANLDRLVDATDLNILGINWRQPGHWREGDFTSDGIVDAADLNQLALNWRRSPSAVPEPAGLALAVIGCLAIAWNYFR